jgi:hypothetical protein
LNTPSHERSTRAPNCTKPLEDDDLLLEPRQWHFDPKSSGVKGSMVAGRRSRIGLFGGGYLERRCGRRHRVQRDALNGAQASRIAPRGGRASRERRDPAPARSRAASA